MELAEFVKISNINDQANILWNQGVFLDERVIYNNFKVLTYSLNNFYVEVTYHIKSNAIAQIKPLISLEDWEGYLSSINLDHLLK